MRPRKAGDFTRNDDVYEELETQQLDKAIEAATETANKRDSAVDPTAERAPRTAEDMAHEAAEFRALFPDNQPSPDSQ